MTYNTVEGRTDAYRLLYQKFVFFVSFLQVSKFNSSVKHMQFMVDFLPFMQEKKLVIPVYFPLHQITSEQGSII